MKGILERAGALVDAPKPSQVLLAGREVCLFRRRPTGSGAVPAGTTKVTYTSGTTVPGWPIGFGDKAQAENYFNKALALNPNGIDTNYLYGDFLFEQSRYKEAGQVLEHALHAPERPNRPLADQGRKREIQALLAQVRAKLADAGTGKSYGG